jgi:hypothetical protein
MTNSYQSVPETKVIYITQAGTIFYGETRRIARWIVEKGT